MLKLEINDWKYTEVASGSDIGTVSILFERIDKKTIEEETERLKNL